MNQRNTFILAALLGALGVGLGAFGAHALKPMLITTGRLDAYQTAVQYQFYHVFALLFTGLMMTHYTVKTLRYAAIAFALGIALFSGSLYVVCFTGVTRAGIITPIGGLFFISGWLLVLWGVIKK